MAKKPTKAPSLVDQPAPGMMPNGELRTLEPGEALPQPQIIDTDGSVLTPAEFDAKYGDDDD